ncbi:MAG: AsmA family protein, partial [Betaproteobacteria bacterium]
MPATLPETLRLPLRVRVHETVIDQLTVVRGGEPREASRLAFDGEAGWQSWTLKVGASETPFGKLDGRLEIGANPPYPVDGHLDVARGGDAPLAVNVIASGTLERAVELNATLRAQSSAADATLVYAPLQAQPIERAAATLRALDLRHLLPSAPEAILDGTLTASTENRELRGTMKVINQVPGAIDAGRVPLSSLAARIGAANDTFTLDAIEAELGDAGKLRGQGRISANEVAFQLGGEQLNVHHVYTALQPTRLTASIETRGDLASQDIRAKLTQRAYRASFDGTVAAGTISVRQARVDIDDSSAEAKGSIGLDSAHPFDIKATLSRFDPSRVVDRGRLGKLHPARLNARVDASGSVQPVVQIRASIDVAPSTAFGLPTTAKVRWRSRGVDKPEIVIDGKASIGETRLGVNGTLVNPQDLRSLDLRLDLSGRDLAQLYTISGLPFPSTPEYELAGHLQYDDRVWTFRRFSGKVGRSDLAGNFAVDRRAAKPFMRADLKSQNLDMRDLAGFVAATDTESVNPPGRLLPHGEFRLDKLNAANADVRFTGERIRNETLPLNRMATHLVLRDGVLALDPLTFGTDAGNIDGKLTLDARNPTIMVVADFSGDQLRLERFAPQVKQVLQTGPVKGRVRLTMHGNSVAAMLGAANGDIALAMTGGSVS